MKKNLRFLRLLPLLALLTVALAALPSLNTHAAGTSQAQSRVLGLRVLNHQGSGKNMIYHGGPVMVGTSVDYIIFWEPTGSQVPGTFNSLIERYFHDVGYSGLYHNNTQYHDSHGNMPLHSRFGAAWVDTQAYPSAYITDAQLQQEITHAMQVNGWTASLQHVFFVYTVAGEHICFNKKHSSCSPNSFCAYHSNFGNVIYAAMPDVLCGTPDSPNHDKQADNVIDSTSHEQNEAATDPQASAWYNAGGNEIGDLCSTSYAPLKFHGGDVLFNGHPYTLQEEWDNAQTKCVIQGP